MKALPHRPVQHEPRGRTVGSLLCGVGLVAICALSAIQMAVWWRQRLPDVHVGEPAPGTVTTPVVLTVEDVNSTKRLREQESRRIRPVFKFDSQASERVAGRFLEKYDSIQIQFLRGLKKSWTPPLSGEELESDEFEAFLKAFQIAHAGFPLSTNLAVQWAADRADGDIRRETAYQIREQQRSYITGSQTGIGAMANHPEYWLLPGDIVPEELTPDDLKKRAHVLNVKSVRSMAEAESNLMDALANHEPQWRDFAAGFLEPNLFYDLELTDAIRRKATRSLIVEESFAAGETVVKTGQPLSPTQFAAITKLREHYALTNISRRQMKLWLFGLGIAGLALGITIRRTSARRVDPEEGSHAPWSGEAQTDQWRSGLLNQMARWLKERFVAGLIDQRNEARENQKVAASKVDQITTRIGNLQPEIQKRIATYEKRIEALEKELVESNAVNKKLIRTRIQLARKELEIEKAKSHLAWN